MGKGSHRAPIFSGLKVYISTIIQKECKEKFKLSDNVDVSPKFRAEHNAKMLAMFGEAPKMYYHQDSVICNQAGFDLLKKVAKNETSIRNNR